MGSGLSLRLPLLPGFTISRIIGVGSVQPSQSDSAWNSSGDPTIDFNDLNGKDVYPGNTNSLLIGNADISHTISRDFNNTSRQGKLIVGAYTRSSAQNPGWKIKPGFKSISTSLQPLPLVLPRDEWKQIALPLSPPSGNNTVAAIFGDDISGVYGTDWILYGYDAANNNYFDPGLNGVLIRGSGYWIIQISNAEALIDIPENSVIAPISFSSACGGLFGCFEIVLPTQLNANQWFMSGHSFLSDVNWNDLRVVTSSGECADTAGCTLVKADELNILKNQAWHFNPQSNAYDIIQNGSRIHGWDGFWMVTLDMAHGLNPKLLVPAPENGT
jgi:hypothetical protein